MSPVTGLILLLTVTHTITSTLGEPQTEEESYNPEKSGVCPDEVDYPICNTGNYTSDCETDKGCDGAKKCCVYKCRKTCLLPLEAKMDSCPYYNHTQCMTIKPVSSECHNDNQCPRTDRCCCKNCRKMCTPTVKVKSEQCPAPLKNCSKTVTKPECSNDGNCTGTKKCCGQTCVTPEKEHAGVCPTSLENLSCIDLTETQCTQDSDCPLEQKCCLSDTIMKCLPVTNEKSGVCPTPVPMCLIYEEPLCESDKICPGDQKCCQVVCRKQCTDVK